MATTYVVFELADSNSILFSQVNQSSAQTLTRNIANTQGIISFQVEPLLQTPEWLTPTP